VLSRLHATLEILLLAESEMKFSISSLQPLAAFCLNNIEASVSKIQCPVRLGGFHHGENSDFLLLCNDTV
jgi:hypothetical protein